MEKTSAVCEVRLAYPFAPESVRLIGELWRELGTLYPEVNGVPFLPSDITGVRTAFVVASLGAQAVGCGAFHSLPDGDSSIAEIKRMYVQPNMRDRGIARAILAKLEELARQADFRTVRLETGSRQPAAIHLYQTAGFRRIERYGRYVDDPLSICFEKSLLTPPSRPAGTFSAYGSLP